MTTIKEYARDLHYILIEQYGLEDEPIKSAQVRDLLVTAMTRSYKTGVEYAVDEVSTILKGDT